MAITGRKPKPPGQRVNRAPQKFEWLEVPDVPNPNPRPMPTRRPYLIDSKNGHDVWIERKWPAGCAEKWEIWSRMPHTIHWTDGDWDYAVDALHAAARATECQGDTKWTLELTKCEKTMGTYRAALLDLRVRYTEPTENAGPAADVARLADYRSL